MSMYPLRCDEVPQAREVRVDEQSAEAEGHAKDRHATALLVREGIALPERARESSQHFSLERANTWHELEGGAHLAGGEGEAEGQDQDQVHDWQGSGQGDGEGVRFRSQHLLKGSAHVV